MNQLQQSESAKCSLLSDFNELVKRTEGNNGSLSKIISELESKLFGENHSEEISNLSNPILCTDNVDYLLNEMISLNKQIFSNIERLANISDRI